MASNLDKVKWQEQGGFTGRKVHDEGRRRSPASTDKLSAYLKRKEEGRGTAPVESKPKPKPKPKPKRGGGTNYRIEDAERRSGVSGD